ncbi:MAG TPA: hypothetical protein VGL53_25670 [Bryobacteraceae bacterium]|jgi:hypothetical protein
MTRRLFYLNALLLLISIGLGTRLRMLWSDARQREDMVRLNGERRLIYRGSAPAPQVQAVNATAYSDIAMRTLFSKDRNPTVIVDVVPPAPEPPVPPFPKSNGVMMFGGPDEARVILTEHNGAGQKIYKFGDTVGDWEIVKFDSKTITLKWHDKEFTKELADLVDNNPIAPVQATQAPAGGSSAVVVKGDSGGVPRPDIPLGNGTKSCAPGDTSPNGTIADGMKKIVVANPFGTSCHWEAVH